MEKSLKYKIKNMKYKFMLKEMITFLLSAIFSKGVSFITFIFIVNKIDANEYGKIELFTTNICILVAILSLQLQEACVRFLVFNEDQKEYKTNILFILIIQSIINLLFMAITGNYLLFIATNISIVIAVLGQYARAFGRSFLYKTNEIFGSLFLFLLVYFWANHNVSEYIMATIISYMGVLVLLVVFLRKDIEFSLDSIKKYRIIEILKYTVPIIPNALSWWIITSADKWILKYFYSYKEVAIYGSAIRLSSIVMLILSNVYLVIQRQFINDYEKNNKSFLDTKFNQKIFNIYFLIITLIIFAFLILPKSIILFIFRSEEYSNVPKLFYLYVPSLVYWALATLFGLGYLLEKKVFALSASTMLAAIINIIGNLYLVPKYECAGAIMSSILALGCWFFIRYRQNRNVLMIYIKWWHYCALFMIQVVSAVRFWG